MISEKLTGFWHGADYNPDQWLDYPEILKKDVELMKKSNCNVMSVGIDVYKRQAGFTMIMAESMDI